jgi:hypothetical protein
MVIKGVLNKTPFSIIRNAPFCWATNKRPSGAKHMTVGLLIPFATSTWLKPVG